MHPLICVLIGFVFHRVLVYFFGDHTVGHDEGYADGYAVGYYNGYHDRWQGKEPDEVYYQQGVISEE